MRVGALGRHRLELPARSHVEGPGQSLRRRHRGIGRTAGLGSSRREKGWSLGRISWRVMAGDRDTRARSSSLRNEPALEMLLLQGRGLRPTQVYGRLGEIARAEGLAHVIDGTNATEAGSPDQPGTAAAAELAVRSPQAEPGLGKDDVRALGMKDWDRPASACLSSLRAHPGHHRRPRAPPRSIPRS